MSIYVYTMYMNGCFVLGHHQIVHIVLTGLMYV